MQGNQSYGVIDVSMDIYLLALPQYNVWKMRMEMRRKIAIALVMGFALVAVIASIMRTSIVFSKIKSYDLSWDGMELTLWSIAELALGIMCTCAPAFRAFFTRKKNPRLVGRMRTLQDMF